MTNKMVIFDFDGVLVDTLLVCYGVHHEVNPATTLPQYKKLFEGNIFDAILPDGTLMKRNHNGLAFDIEHTVGTRIPQVLKDAVIELSQKCTLVIVSSTASEAINIILEREGLKKYFKDVLGRLEGESKVEKIQHLLSKHAVLSEDSVFVTDTLGDIREAEKCGARAIGVTWGFNDAETLQKGDPAALVSSQEDLLGTVLKVIQ